MAPSEPRIFGTKFSLDIVIHPGAGAYICGEETALIESLEGRRGLPAHQAAVLPSSDRPLWRADRRQQRRDGFRSAMDPAARGKGVCRPRRRLFDEARASSRFRVASNARAGTSSRWRRRLFATSSTSRRLGEASRTAATSRRLFRAVSLRHGSAPSTSTWASIRTQSAKPGRCSARVRSSSWTTRPASCAPAWRITRFFHRESCGQCTPCREGGQWLEKILRRIEEGEGRESDLDLLMDVCDNLAPGVSWPPQQTTICVLGPSIPSSIASAIRMFRDEVLEHVEGRGCPLRGCQHGDRHTMTTETDTAETDTTVTLTIDGRRIAASHGELIIDAAERAGIFIPRFCYHPRMAPVGMCRMCLVEVSGPRGFSLQPACFFSVSEGQEILPLPRTKPARHKRESSSSSW